jgi:hypothetical protein
MLTLLLLTSFICLTTVVGLASQQTSTYVTSVIVVTIQRRYLGDVRKRTRYRCIGGCKVSYSLRDNYQKDRFFI